MKLPARSSLGRLVLASALATALTGQAASGDEFWDRQFGVPGAGGWGVSPMVISGGKLFVGGGLTSLGGVTVTNIGCWDGTNWSPLGSGLGRGLGEGPSALAVAGDNLFAGGYFPVAGGVSANNIARWDGSNWYPLGAGVNGYISGLATDGSNVYAGGDFTSAGGIAARNIARWDGLEWQPLGSGLSGPVYAVVAANGSVYAGGRFYNAGGIAATNIARWDGTNWHPLGNGLRVINGFSSENGSVRSLIYHRGCLYAGGGFRLAGNLSATDIARWDGTNWWSIGDAANWVQAFAPNGKDLFVGGSFLQMSGQLVRGIAKWDGTNWSNLGSGFFGGSPVALACTGTELFAGGGFTVAGDKPSASIALWHIPHSLGIERSGDQVLLSWPATGTNFLLEATSDLGVANWQGVSGTPSIVNDQCVVTLPLGPANQFFRLRRR